MPELLVYSTSWCPDCRNLKRFLETEGIGYREIDIDDHADEAEALLAATGKRGIPYMRLGDEWVKGYPMDAGAFRAKLKELGLK